MSNHRPIVGLRELGRVNPLPHPVTWWLTGKALRLLQTVRGGVRVEIEGFPELREPVLFAMNHSHYYDFTASRLALWDQCGIQTVGFVKARAYQNRLEGAYVKSIGNIPLISRGYLISADFASIHGRRPDEGEYRHLREHVDHAVPLPPERCYDPLQTTARDMLDHRYDPSGTSYREAIHERYASAMATSLGQARTVIRSGRSLHIYPQGLFSSRLSKGRIGAVQFALGLDIPIVPVGFSGMNERFAKNQMVPNSPGVLTMRFGEPRRVDAQAFVDFQPFAPDHELRARGALEQETQRVMDAINGLLDPGYTWGADLDGDGLEGVSRFFD